YILTGEPISQTGAAVIYRASREDDGDREGFYAIKEYLDPAAAEIFSEHEKKISMEINEYSLKREVVIPVPEILKENGKKYALMQFKKHGMFLSDLIEELETNHYYGLEKSTVCIRLLKEILKSLEVMHNCNLHNGITGYLHLDLHPGNIFFENVDIKNGDYGTVKFIDFASVRPLRGNTIAPDVPDYIVANPAYAAPEYLQGNFHAVCRATDLYSVGRIYLRMLLGQALSDMDEDDGSIQDDSLSEVCGSELKASVIRPFLSCILDYNPRYRYQSEEEVLQMLEHIEAFLQNCDTPDYYKLFSYLFENRLLSDCPPEQLSHQLAFKTDNLTGAVDQLKEAIRGGEIQTSASRLFYIFKGLRGLVSEHKDAIRPTKKNQLLCCGITCCNYIGESKEALSLLEEFQSGTTQDGMSDIFRNENEYLDLINHVAVTIADGLITPDGLGYRKAYDLVSSNITWIEKINASKQDRPKLPGMETGKAGFSYELACSYSAKGCYMTLLELLPADIKTKFDEQDVKEEGLTPLDYFKKALEEFGTDSFNCTITTSHILNYAIETDDRLLFEMYAHGYFGAYETDTLTECLERLLDESRFDAFKLYVFLKGVYAFYLDLVGPELLELLAGVIHREYLYSKNHPMELVFRYIALIFSRVGNETEAVERERAFVLAMTFVPEAQIHLQKHINISSCITYQTMYLYHLETGQPEMNETLYNDFIEHCRLSGEEQLLILFDSPDRLNEVLRFEYA
ncbi:MAG: hypothetical protein LUI07_04480, partial [Lachnospiraceae bacterium]|nr:hypothetical protein [Lachnospiraceae bacterium]